MEIKAELNNATEEQKIDFIIEYNHNQGYTIEQEIVSEEEIVDEEGNTTTVYTYNLKALGYTEEELEAQKRERIAKLKLTKREVFLGLYQAKGVTPDMIKAQITDPQALIEFEYANDYYRGNPLIDIVGATLGITPEQLNKFFEFNDYTYLLPVEVEDEDPTNTTL
jgi:hypothetical protein